ncbi:probable insulin-like peptide 3 [Drosophila kikkawai]|uniref:Probable insulin-like peptide 3 n=1 Tax=Drosophila kikkawai TaxID=30033 RepID=A0ABM4GHE6_DROKI
MSRFMLALILLLIPFLGRSETEASGSVMYNQCGDGLMELMSKMCNNQFNGHFDGKRGDLNLFDYVDSMVDTDDAAGAVIRPHHPRMNSLMATRRLSRYVAKECCLKPCSREEINAHCAKSPQSA